VICTIVIIIIIIFFNHYCLFCSEHRLCKNSFKLWPTHLHPVNSTTLYISITITTPTNTTTYLQTVDINVPREYRPLWGADKDVGHLIPGGIPLIALSIWFATCLGFGENWTSFRLAKAESSTLRFFVTHFVGIAFAIYGVLFIIGNAVKNSTSHVLFGQLITQTGILSVLMGSTSLLKGRKVFDICIPLVVFLSGLMMWGHEQHSSLEIAVHQAIGISFSKFVKTERRELFSFFFFC